MIKKFIIALLGFAAVVAILGGVKAAQIKEMMSAPHVMPDASVATIDAKAVEWRSYIKAIGSLAPVEGVTLSAEAEGAVLRIAVESGSAVKAGDLLVEIDSSVERAQLAAAEARASLAQVGLERAKNLLSNNTVAKSEFDSADATYKQAMAEVASLKATLDKKVVRAPFDGRVGIRLINAGQYVSRGVPLMPLQKLDPIYVNFAVPQRQLSSLTVGQKVLLHVDGAETTEGKGFEGKINAINSEVDAATRNVTVQAIIANPSEVLRSGMFARVEVELPQTDSLIVVPATAISYASYGNFVFVVEKMKGEDGKEYLGVRQESVTVGLARGDLVAISGNVKAGDAVVAAGVFKLRNKVPVQINNDVVPSSSATPKPANT
jgi:membrane fusion protein (multidrug efflux system)